MTHASYDLIAIGSGPAGRRAAIEAARLGKRAAIVEREGALGGAAAVRPQTLRAAVVKLTAGARRSEITIDDLSWRTEQVVEHEQEAIADELRRNRVDVLPGTAAFADPHTLEIRCARASYRASAERFVIAVGRGACAAAGVDFDGRTVLDCDGFQRLPGIPATLTIVGAGAIGLEYASIAAALGCAVTLVDRRARVLDLVDVEIVEALVYHLRGLGVVLRLGQEVAAVERGAGAAVSHLRGGERIASEAVIHTARQGAGAGLRLAAAGLAADDRGLIAAGPDHRTAQRHIFAAGDVNGLIPSRPRRRSRAGLRRSPRAASRCARSLRRSPTRSTRSRRSRSPAATSAACGPLPFRTSAASPATASSRAARSRATAPACSSCSCTPGRGASRACTCSAPRRPS